MQLSSKEMALQMMPFPMFVTHVQGLGPFLKVFGQRHKENMNLIRASIEIVLKKIIAKPAPRVVDLVVGSLCLARYFHGQFCRARIIQLGPDSIIVHFIDYGHEHCVGLLEVRLLNYESQETNFLQVFESQASEFVLSGIRCDWRPEQLNAIFEFLKNKLVQVHYDMEIGHLTFVSIQINHRSLVEHLTTEKGIGYTISLDQQREELISKSNRITLNSHHANNLNNQDFLRVPARRLAPARQLRAVVSQPQHFTRTPILGMAMGLPSPIVRPNIMQMSRGTAMSAYAPIFQPLNMAPSPPVKRHDSPPKRSVVTFKSNTLMVGSSYEVYCCFVENGPCLFAVHLKATENELNKMMTELEECALKNISDRPSVGMACIARFSEDQHLYRAVIMNIKPTTCQVSYVDYGNTETVPFQDLYEIPIKFLEHKSFAIRFALSGCKDLEPITDATKNIFKDMVLQKPLKLKVMPLEGPPLVQYCELLDGNVNILHALRSCTNKLLVYGRSDTVTSNEIVVIRYVESPRKFFVQKVANIRGFDKMMDDLFLFCKMTKIPLKNFAKGSACAAPFEDSWYRAEIIEDFGPQVRIRHVDFGNERNIERQQLCAIFDKCVQFPKQAIMCCLKGFETDCSLSDSAATQLEMLAETTDNERRHFKCQLFEYHPNGVALVNLIDDSIKPELNLMKRLYKLSMPFNMYMVMEKEVSKIGGYPIGNGDDAPISGYYNEQQRTNVLTSTPANPPPNVILNSTSLNGDGNVPHAQQNTEWDVASSGSGDTKASSPTSDQSCHRPAQHHLPPKNFRDNNNRRENTYGGGYRGKQNLPPRFQKQQAEGRNKQRENRHPQSSYQDRFKDTSSEGSEKLVHSSRNFGRNESGYFDTSSTATIEREHIRVEKYLPHDYEFPTDYVAVPCQEEVIICWWISPHQFYTHHKSKVHHFEKIMKEIQSFYENKPPVTILPTVGSSVIARYREDNILYRGKINACNPALGKFKVQFVDFGNQSTVDLQNIWTVEARFGELPAMAHLCSFDQIITNYELKHITNHVEKYLTENARLVCDYIRKENNTHYVDVKVNGMSLRESLINDGIVTQIDPDIEIEMLSNQDIRVNVVSVKDLLNFQVKIEGCDLNLMCSYPDIKLVKTNGHLSTEFKRNYEGKTCVARVVNVSKEKILMLQPLIPLFVNDVPTKRICDRPIISSVFKAKLVHVEQENIFYIHSVTLEDTVAQLLDDLFNYYDTNGQLLTDKSAGTLCAVNSADGNWYRGYIQSESADPSYPLTVYYLDYGNTEQITDMQNLKILEEKFCNISALAVRVYLPITSIASDENITVINEIKTLTNELELSLQILERYNGEWIVDLSSDGCSLINVLINKNLIKGSDMNAIKALIDSSELEIVNKDPKPTAQRTNLIDTKTIKTPQLVESAPEVIAAKVVDIPSVAIDEDFSKEDSPDVRPHEDLLKGMSPAYISYCDDPTNFYLQYANTYRDLEKLQDNLQIVARSLPPLMTIVTGAKCIALYSVDETWYRAKILDSELMAIKFIDYGNTDIITNNSHIKEMNEAFEHIEPFAVPCALPIGPKCTSDWIDEANTIFNQAYEKTVYFDIISKCNNLNYVRVKIDGVDVAQKLIADGMAKPLEIVRSGGNCYISHINSLSDFYIQMESDSDGLELIAAHLTDFESFKILQDCDVGCICAAIFPDDSQWYRARVISKINGTIQVLFMDYGNTTTTTELREISPDIANLPPLSKRCSLRMPNHILGWSDAAEAKFCEMAAMGETVFVIELVQPNEAAEVDLTSDGKNLLEQLEPLCDKTPIAILDISTTSIETDLSGVAKPPASLLNAVVSHANSPNDFYIQLDEDLAQLEDITENLNGAASFKKLQTLELNTICAAIFPDDGAFYRAKVISLGDGSGSCEVIFIDFGNTAITTDFRELPEDCKNLEPLAKHCALHNLSEIDFWSETAKENFNSLISSRIGETFQVELIIQKSDPWVVNLFFKDTNVSNELAKLITDLVDLWTSGHAKENTMSIKETSDAAASLVARKTVIVSHANTPNDFYIQLDEDSVKLEKIGEALAKAEDFEQETSGYKFDEICAAVFPDDGVYYRAKILSTPAADCYEVFFIDYGNVCVTKELRSLPQDLKTIDNLAKQCALHNLSTVDFWSQSAVDQFNSITSLHFEATFQVEVIENKSDPWIVDLFYDGKNVGAELMKHAADRQTCDSTEMWSTVKDSSATLATKDVLDNIIEGVHINDEVSRNILEKIDVQTIVHEIIEYAETLNHQTSRENANQEISWENSNVAGATSDNINAELKSEISNRILGNVDNQAIGNGIVEAIMDKVQKNCTTATISNEIVENLVESVSLRNDVSNFILRKIADHAAGITDVTPSNNIINNNHIPKN